MFSSAFWFFLACLCECSESAIALSPSVAIGSGVSIGCISKMLKFYINEFFSDGQGADRPATLNEDRSFFYYLFIYLFFKLL